MTEPFAPMSQALSEGELEELEHSLLNLDTEDGMLLESLDGYLHAIAMGPKLVMPSRWLPQVWGQEYSDAMPPTDDLSAAERLLGLVMRHYNNILQGLAQRPAMVAPIWGNFFQNDDLEDAEMWAYGFCQGVELARAAWRPLFNDSLGQRYFRPIGLLGRSHFSPDQDALTRTPEQRHALCQDIPESLLRINAFWLPRRGQGMAALPGQRTHTKVGRNEPCPCGSGKKFKKCCGTLA